MKRSRSHSSPPSRSRSIPDRHFAANSRKMSAEEKRELILAHAAAREGHPQGWNFGYVIGVTASCLIVVTGWALTVGSNLRAQLPGTAQQAAQAIQQVVPVQQITSNKTDIMDELRTQYQAAIVKVQAMKAAAGQIQELTASSTQK